MLPLKQELLTYLDQSRQATLDLIEGLEPTHIIYPGWTLKEFLAHLTGWDDATIASLQAHAAGKEPGTPAYRGIDFYNMESVATRVDLNFDQVYREWELARQTLKDVIRDLADEKFEVPIVFPWGPTGKVRNLVAVMINHEFEHASELHKTLKPEAAEPEKKSEDETTPTPAPSDTTPT